MAERFNYSFSSTNNKMQFCPYCGAKLDERARFCKKCGEAIVKNTGNTNGSNRYEYAEENPSKRKTVYEGYLHKCPRCGEILESFVTNCPSCGYEIRGAKSATSVKEFELRLESISSEQMPINTEKKSVMKMLVGKDFNSDDDDEARKQFENQKREKIASLIINYSVPNTKEDILEFMLLASSNINVKKNGYSDIVSQAWLSKLEQVYKKAEITMHNQHDFNEVKAIYDQKMKEIKWQKEKRFLLMLAFFVILIFLWGILWNPVATIFITVFIVILIIVVVVLLKKK